MPRNVLGVLVGAALFVFAGCSSTPEPRAPRIVMQSGYEGFVLARFDVRGCFSEELLEDAKAQPQFSGTFGTPLEGNPALREETTVLRRRIEERTGEQAWRKPASLEFDPDPREILVLQRPEFLVAIELAIRSVREERKRR